MGPLLKLYTSYFQYIFTHAVAGRTWNNIPPKQTFLTARIHSPLLARELENACNKDGFLTYEEFLNISQFGKHGYYATHIHHGMTNTFLRWGSPLFKIAKEHGIDHIVEFGCGDGKLGVETLLAAKQQKYSLVWSGIDISKTAQKKAKKLFEKNKLEEQIKQIVSNTEELSLKKRVLFILSYSLDSIPPQQFITTSEESSYPTHVLGISIKNCVITEIPLDEKMLKQKSILLSKGIYKEKNNYSLDFSMWHIQKGQRLFLPIMAATTLAHAISLLPKDSLIIDIDEFYPPPFSFDYGHRALPKDLDKFTLNRETTNLLSEYKNAGNNLLYYPSFLKTYLSLLQSCGCTVLTFGDEYKIAENYPIQQKNKQFGACLAIIAKKVTQPQKKLILEGY